MSWNLYLMRHGIAVDGFGVGMRSDADRPLTEKGRQRVAQVGKAMASMELDIGLVISSPYVRAWQTAETVMAELQLERMEEDPRITPMGDPMDIHDVILEHQREYENILLVAHEPYLSSTISYLLTGGHGAMVEVKKASLTSLRFPGYSQQPPAVLEWMLSPRWVRALNGCDED